jgi:hypothetical protein
MPLMSSMMVKRILIGVAAALAATYAVDFAYVWLRARHASASDPFETLTAPRVYAIAEKGQKTEYQIDAENPEQKVTCVHSLFPHDGYASCWQVRRTLHEPIPR